MKINSPITSPIIIRSRRKTIELVIQADGKLVVRVPQRATNPQIQAVLEQKAEWIRAGRAEVLAHPKAPAKKYADGEEFWFLGKTYPLLIVEGQKSELELDGGGFKFDSGALPQAQAVFTNWYRRQARQALTARVEHYATLHHFSYRQIKITSARQRWGSCSSRGVLSFPWRLVMAPPAAIDYVVVHELAHTRVRGHQRDFWEIVRAIMPQYKQYAEWLKKNGQMLALD